MLDSGSESRIQNILADLIAVKDRRTFKRTRKALRTEPADEVIAALIQAIRETKQAHAFERFTTLLAEYGGEKAFEMLALQARTQKQFPRLAVRALAECVHEGVVPVLIDLVEYGRKKQRESAVSALGRIRDGRCIRALAATARNSASDVHGEALEELRRMGRMDDLARSVLAASALTTVEQLEALDSLEVLYPRIPSFFFGRFQTTRFLAREALKTGSFVQQQAWVAAELLYQQQTLVRPSEQVDGTNLLRAAFGPGSNNPDTLMRAANSMTEGPERLRGFAGIRRAVVQFLRVLLRIR